MSSNSVPLFLADHIGSRPGIVSVVENQISNFGAIRWIKLVVIRLVWMVTHFRRIERIFISAVLRIASFLLMSRIGKLSAQRDVRLEAMAMERLGFIRQICRLCSHGLLCFDIVMLLASLIECYCWRHWSYWYKLWPIVKDGIYLLKPIIAHFYLSWWKYCNWPVYIM